MKKTVAVIFIGMFVISCKKEYKCECHYIVTERKLNGVPVEDHSYTSVYSLGNKKKSSNCVNVERNERETVSEGVEYTSHIKGECTIK